jgi:branched-chain amino acid transport system permease protein
MGFFVEVLISGLMAGVLYSLVALGFVLIFKASGVFNFAQGAMVLFAALTFVRLLDILKDTFAPITIALIITIAMMVVLRISLTVSVKPYGEVTFTR